MKDIIEPPEKERFEDVYIVYELMDTDLHQIIRSSQTLTDDHCQVGIPQISFKSQFQVILGGHIHYQSYSVVLNCCYSLV